MKNAIKVILVLSITFALGAASSFAYLGNAEKASIEASVKPNTKLKSFHSVLCISETGDAETYEIPVPELIGFDPVFVEEYYEQAGKDFCESLIDDTQYVQDVGEDR